MTSGNTNIFALIPEDYLNLLASKNWQERKSTLELMLQKFEEVNELDKSVSYDELLDSLRKVLLLLISAFEIQNAFHNNL